MGPVNSGRLLYDSDSLFFFLEKYIHHFWRGGGNVIDIQLEKFMFFYFFKLCSFHLIYYFRLKKDWMDSKLNWEPDEYGGVEQLIVPSELLWLPDILLYNK